MKNLVLIINPGSTSTKISVFNTDGQEVNKQTIRHDPAEIAGFNKIIDQYEFRAAAIDSFLSENNISQKDFAFIVGRGGLLKPIKSGTWVVNEKMLEDLRKAERGEHASNLGAMIAYKFASANSIPAYIVDPVVVDELDERARITGFPEIKRTSIFHALNQKAVARRAAADLGLSYDSSNFIVVHMGGGTTVGAHKNGKVIDVTNGLSGEGPMTPERSGVLPAEDVINLCFSGNFTKAELIKKLRGKGGIIAHLGTSDMRVVEDEIKKGNTHYKFVYDAMIYQTAKDVGAMAIAALEGKIDAIVITGGLAFDKYLVRELSSKTEFLAPIIVYPGEDEMSALFTGASLSLQGKAPLNEYN